MSPKIFKQQRLHCLIFFSDRGYSILLKNFKRQRLCHAKITKSNILAKYEAIFKNILGGYSRAPGWLNCEKNRKSKILWHCPFKEALVRYTHRIVNNDRRQCRGRLSTFGYLSAICCTFFWSDLLRNIHGVKNNFVSFFFLSNIVQILFFTNITGDTAICKTEYFEVKWYETIPTSNICKIILTLWLFFYEVRSKKVQ